MKNNLCYLILILLINQPTLANSNGKKIGAKRVVPVAFSEQDKKPRRSKMRMIAQAKKIVAVEIGSEHNEVDLEPIGDKIEKSKRQSLFVGPPEPTASSFEAFPERDINSEKKELILTKKDAPPVKMLLKEFREQFRKIGDDDL